MEKRVLILTGPSGIGKTTALARAVSTLRGRGVSIGGMFSREVRKGTTRVGFEVVDVASAKVGWLAHVDQQGGPRVGKYHVNLHALETIGTQGISKAMESCDVVAIDEIGPMELTSVKFKQTTQEALESNKLIIAVVHWKAKDALVQAAKNRKDAEVFTVTTENREAIHEVLFEKAVAFLSQA